MDQSSQLTLQYPIPMSNQISVPMSAPQLQETTIQSTNLVPAKVPIVSQQLLCVKEFSPHNQLFQLLPKVVVVSTIFLIRLSPQHLIIIRLSSTCPVTRISMMKSHHFTLKSLQFVNKNFLLVHNSQLTNYLEVALLISQVAVLSNLSPTLSEIPISLPAPFFP